MSAISVVQGQTAALNRKSSADDFQHIKMGLLFKVETLELSMSLLNTLRERWLSMKVEDHI